MMKLVIVENLLRKGRRPTWTLCVGFRTRVNENVRFTPAEVG
jgi:hypothetical protein